MTIPVWLELRLNLLDRIVSRYIAQENRYRYIGEIAYRATLISSSAPFENCMEERIYSF